MAFTALQVIVIEKGTYTPAAKLTTLEKNAYDNLYEKGGLMMTSEDGGIHPVWGGYFFRFITCFSPQFPPPPPHAPTHPPRYRTGPSLNYLNFCCGQSEFSFLSARQKLATACG